MIKERLELAFGRLKELEDEHVISEPFGGYFRSAARFAISAFESVSKFPLMDIKEKRLLIRRLYEPFSDEGYEESFADPAFAVSKLGEYGSCLSFLYYQLRDLIPFSFELSADERRYEDIAILLEVLLEVYSCFAQYEGESLPSPGQIRDILYWFVSDYADVTVNGRVREQLDPSLDFALRIIMESDLSDTEYLYSFGEYVTEYEEKTARYLASLPEEKIQSMADTFTEGYVRGFMMTGKDIKKKSTVNIRYRLGFERVVRAAVKNFEKQGLKSIIYRRSVHLLTASNGAGYFGAIPSRQCESDHREDIALFLDKALTERRLEILREAYKENEQLARMHAGPAVMETFGEPPFSPVIKKERATLDDKQQKLSVAFLSGSGVIVNEYIPEEERSFTIIAYPDARIGEDFGGIFEETIRLNTLDYLSYQRIQQALIDFLDGGECVRILGGNGNETDLTVKLRRLEEPDKQTQFENCTADVNIPVGEVFTSPVLEGTNGVLHVKEVYLEGLRYENLRFVFKDGYVTDYGCTNFEDMAEGRRYIKENVLYNHETLPMGEFAIGTNTTAYAMAKRYGIFDRLPILIAEKTGPHFALGDTCYSRSEDIAVFNPDGKEIVSRDNSRSLLRREKPDEAYFNCHTDVTIPYEELSGIRVIYPDGSGVSIIENGLFAPEGARELNAPLIAQVQGFR